MTKDLESSRIRELLDQIDAVTAESKLLREHIERLRGQAAAWPEPTEAEPVGSSLPVSGRRTRP